MPDGETEYKEKLITSTAQFLLPVAFYQLPYRETEYQKKIVRNTAPFLLPVACYLLPVTYCLFHSTSYQKTTS